MMKIDEVCQLNVLSILKPKLVLFTILFMVREGE